MTNAESLARAAKELMLKEPLNDKELIFFST